MLHAAFRQEHQDEVLTALRRDPKEIPSKFFYDAAGCELFEQICKLPEYYPTRTELSIMESRIEEISEAIGANAVLIEYGSGASLKTRMLLDAMAAPLAYVPLDIAIDHLQDAADALRQRYPNLTVLPTYGDFTQEIELPDSTPTGKRVVYFPGSTIGNLKPKQAIDLLQRIHRLVGADGGLLLGVDLVKEAEVLNAAYDDSQGVTAEFNRNTLRHVNRAADANFDPDQFEHLAFYHPTQQRVEMHLESRLPQTVRVGETDIQLQQGERIRTELSHKYQRSTLEDMCLQAGLKINQWWTDERQWFGIAWIETCEGAE